MKHCFIALTRLVSALTSFAPQLNVPAQELQRHNNMMASVTTAINGCITHHKALEDGGVDGWLTASDLISIIAA